MTNTTDDNNELIRPAFMKAANSFQTDLLAAGIDPNTLNPINPVQETTNQAPNDLNLDTQEILQAAIAMTGLKKGAFARKADINPSDLNRYLKGEHQMGIETISKLLKVHGINARIVLEPLSPKPPPAPVEPP